MKISSLVWGAIAAYVVSQSESDIPQAVGLDVDGLIAQYLPAIIGVIVAIMNNSDSIPGWLKKIVEDFGKSKGADMDFGNSALAVYSKMLEMLEELKKDPQTNSQQIANMRLALLAQHEKVVGYGPDED